MATFLYCVIKNITCHSSVYAFTPSYWQNGDIWGQLGDYDAIYCTKVHIFGGMPPH